MENIEYTNQFLESEEDLIIIEAAFEYRDFLIKSYKKTKLDTSSIISLYLDSIIAPSAVNEEFYEKINYLAPYGSGYNEPKFVVENLKVIKSNTVGKNHIKSILCGKDGTGIKSIAFNAVNSSFESILNQKNKKLFNIAGKITSNEWKGKRNIEFIIEDISLN